MAENPNINEKVDSDVLIDKIAEKLDSVTRLDLEPLSFSDLPNELLGDIVEKLDVVSRMITRKVSRRLRDVVDKQKAEYGTISIFTEKNRVDIVFDDEVLIHYSKSGCFLDDMDYGELKRKFIKDDNFLEIALNDLTIALKKPKFRVTSLELLFSIHAEAETAKIINLMQSLEYPIHSKTLRITSIGNYEILPILSLLKSGTLENFEICCEDSNLNVVQLVKMNQWKQAKRVHIKDIDDAPIPIDIEDFIHFDRFASYVDSISLQDVLRLRESFSKSINFERCDLIYRRIPVNLGEIGRALGATVNQTPWGPTIVHCHPIPGSNKFLECKINREGLSIERKP